MAAAAFLALAHTLKRGEHIRVTLILNHLPAQRTLARRLEPRRRRHGRGLLAWFAIRLVLAILPVQRCLAPATTPRRCGFPSSAWPSAPACLPSPWPMDLVLSLLASTPSRSLARRRTRPQRIRDATMDRDHPLPDHRPLCHPRQRHLDRPGPARRRLDRHGVVFLPPGRRRHGRHHLGRVLLLDPDRAAAVPLDGRDPVPHQALRRHVQGPRALAGKPAGPPAPHQHHRLHHLRRGLRFVGRHLRHHRQDHAARAGAAAIRSPSPSARWPAPARSAC
jgi:hypothetical protein